MINMNIDRFTITSYDQLTGFSKSTGSLEMIMDELNDFTLSHEEESDPITGRGGRTIANLKKSKKVTGKGTNGMLSGGALAAMVGSEVEDGDYTIRYTDPIVVSSDSATTTETAVGTVGNEIGTIYVRDNNKAYISGGKKSQPYGLTTGSAGGLDEPLRAFFGTAYRRCLSNPFFGAAYRQYFTNLWYLAAS